MRVVGFTQPEPQGFPLALAMGFFPMATLEFGKVNLTVYDGI
jgi:hypothetical protein